MIVIMASWPVKFLFSTLLRLLVLPTNRLLAPDPLRQIRAAKLSHFDTKARNKKRFFVFVYPRDN